MTFDEKVMQELNAETDHFLGGVATSKKILKPTLDKIIDAFDEIKHYISPESQVGLKLKEAIKEYKALQL